MWNREERSHAVTLRQLVARLFGAAIGLALGGVTVVALVPTSQEEQIVRAPAKGSPAWLVEKHDCWTGAAPADMEGQVPGHVVATRRGATGPTYGGPVLVGLALEQVFDGVDHGLRVHAFCR